MRSGSYWDLGGYIPGNVGPTPRKPNSGQCMISRLIRKPAHHPHVQRRTVGNAGMRLKAQIVPHTHKREAIFRIRQLVAFVGGGGKPSHVRCADSDQDAEQREHPALIRRVRQKHKKKEANTAVSQPFCLISTISGKLNMIILSRVEKTVVR
jgi:hypothetical protein